VRRILWRVRVLWWVLVFTAEKKSSIKKGLYKKCRLLPDYIYNIRMFLNKKQWNYIQQCYHLTPRQIEVAKHVCDGLDNHKIARKCRIKYNTARTHVANICARVAVHGRAEMILRFLKVSKEA